jgi:DNA polymerase-4
MRKIIHVDMDCFFAAVEMRDNPALRDIPIAIGGSGYSAVLSVRPTIRRVNSACAAPCLPPWLSNFAHI